MGNFGPYTVHEQLGVGGMATVHRAEVELEGELHTVALKRLHPELARNTSFVRRFIDEGRLGQRLRHANIAKTYDVGCIDNTHYIALECVRGPTALRLLQHSIKREPIPIHIALHIITQIARALAYAHGLRDDHDQPLRLIHRDIAPSNIIISESGAAKLIDFGVAKSTKAHVRTAVGSVIGKLGYIAPEYLSGKLDARVDLYSLGVVAHELLTGRPLFEVDDVRTAELLRVLDIDPPSSINPCVPAELDHIVLTALQRNPDDRWQSAYAMFTALANLRADTGLEISDADVAKWVASELADIPRAETLSHFVGTSEIELAIDDAFYKITDGAQADTPAPGL